MRTSTQWNGRLTFDTVSGAPYSFASVDVAALCQVGPGADVVEGAVKGVGRAALNELAGAGTPQVHGARPGVGEVLSVIVTLTGDQAGPTGRPLKRKH